MLDSCKVRTSATSTKAWLLLSFVWLVLVAGHNTRTRAQTTIRTDKRAPTPLEDDAHLYDIQFVGSNIGWAVGDRGVIWNTQNAGQSWDLIPTGFDCPLRKVCFLTDRVGWIVGGGTTPFTRQGYGVVLFTSDAGATWQQLAREQLPRLHHVRFWDLHNGIVVGDSTARHASGVFVTADGGKTWDHLVADKSNDWRAADFLAPDVGVVVGLRGQVRLVGGQQLLHPRLSDLGLRGLHSVKLQTNDTGWLVGDGGLVLRTDSGGVVWQSPAGRLAAPIRDIFDFRTVATRGAQVWIAGRPGSVVWHTANHGQSWAKQYTGQPLPIHDLTFVSDTLGWAVGALGQMSRTDDGGQTWKTVRGGGRRIAFLCVHARPDQVSWRMLAKWSGDLGYRSAVSVISRPDVGPDGYNQRDVDIRLHEAVIRVGGSESDVHWRLPVLIPGIERHPQKLLSEWNRQTEGRLTDVLHGHLVVQIRTWRPSIVVVDEPTEHDAATSLLKEAVLTAVTMAADPTSLIHHSQLAALPPWQVEKVYVRLPEGSSGDLHVDAYEVLPRMECTVEAAASRGYVLIDATERSSQHDNYRPIFDRRGPDTELASAGNRFFGVDVPPGSPTRRFLQPLNESQRKRQQQIAEKQRNLNAYLTRYLNDPVRAAQLIGEIDTITKAETVESAIGQLQQLSTMYQQHSRWDLVAATQLEIVKRYPNEAAAHESMRWLLQYYNSEEMNWQRRRHINVRLRTQSSNQQAFGLAQLISRHVPTLYNSPEVEFPLAALLRKRQSYRLANEFYRHYQSAGTDAPWMKTARDELWLSQPTGQPPEDIVSCRATPSRPILDGILSDSCWKVAQEIPLKETSDDRLNPERYAFCLLAYDAEYLYLAASVPRVTGLPADQPIREGRRHDADLTDFDRISLFLDIDRDYATYYSIHIDQRGWVSESCWHDTSWNPKMYVAADANTTHWRVEAAIRLKDIAPQTPMRNTVWAMGILRTMPTVGLQSWTHPAASHAQPQTFGLLKFD